MRIRKRHLLWLSILGVVTGVALLSGVPPLVGIALLALFGVAAAVTLVELHPRELLQRSRASLTARRMTAEAREAAERARRRGGEGGSVLLLDIGLIAMQMGHDGVTMRRTRSASRDEDGIRPFATLFVPPEAAEREVIVRWELVDRGGEPQYIHEMKQYLRPGDNNLIPDHHLPLAENPAPLKVGEWDLRVFIDGRLIGEHAFTIVPTFAERFPELAARQAARDAARLRAEPRDRDAARAPAGRMRLQADDTPMSLEDLLRRSEHAGSDSGQQNGRRS
ncbi:MAG: hypothetical protein ACUVS2_14160 [Candidatus Flexifilum sp.]